MYTFRGDLTDTSAYLWTEQNHWPSCAGRRSVSFFLFVSAVRIQKVRGPPSGRGLFISFHCFNTVLKQKKKTVKNHDLSIAVDCI